MRIIIASILSLITQFIYAGTVCISPCPGGTPPPSGFPANLTEVTIEGDGFLEIDFARTLYLDVAVYQSHLADFTLFSSDTAIVFDPIPEDYSFPSYSELTTLGLNGVTFADIGIGSDAIIRNMNFTGEIRFHAAGDILVTDTSSLIATPIPASLLMFMSGVAALGWATKRKI
ncbi:MAG: hypothetical protein ABW166_12970 [Sedimenticola sp.]